MLINLKASLINPELQLLLYKIKSINKHLTNTDQLSILTALMKIQAILEIATAL